MGQKRFDVDVSEQVILVNSEVEKGTTLGINYQNDKYFLRAFSCCSRKLSEHFQ